MAKVFADTGFFRVLADDKDTRYEDAFAYMEVLLNEGYIFVLTDYVFAEVILRVRYDVAWLKAKSIGDEIINRAEFEIIKGCEYFNSAWENYFSKYSDKRFSFADCVSFDVMERLGISEVITTDEDFERVNRNFIPIYI